jgi:hypothetical protein
MEIYVGCMNDRCFLENGPRKASRLSATQKTRGEEAPVFTVDVNPSRDTEPV